MPQDFTQKLADYRQAIDQALASYFNSDAPRLGLRLQDTEVEALEELKKFSLRAGKRIRGSLALFAYDEFSDHANPSAIKLSIALEMIQNYLLIIDDVMDRSSFRRGQPAMHKMFEQKKGVSAHISKMMAIDSGMLAQHMASALLAEVDESAENIRQMSQVFHKNIAATAYGQFDDLVNTKLGNLDEDQLIRLYELKTSYYTFINPLQTGALLGGKHSDELMSHIEAIGLPAGVGFQLQDDILGIFGAENQTGKSNLDDLREGKITLLMLYTLERASQAQLKELKSALGNKDLSAAEHKNVQRIIEECGARAAAEDRISHYAQMAQKEVHSSSFFSQEAKSFLLNMIKYATNRTL
jgi:geranylgeranyl diphosphate synthase type I